LVELPQRLPKLAVDEDQSALPAMHLPPAGPWCAFCGRADTSAEHIFPRWVSKELNELAPLETRTAYGPRRTTTINLTAPVCTLCNTRWLSVLENDVKPVLAPMLRGAEQGLSPFDQAQLATWAVKTAFMLDLGSASPLIPAGFYHQLRQRRRPLESNVVLCGANLGTRKAIWAEHRGLHIGVGGSEPANAFVTTFSVSRILFQVVGHFTKSELKVEDSRPEAVGLIQLWPNRSKNVRWPRRQLAFDDAALADLAARISG